MTDIGTELKVDALIFKMKDSEKMDVNSEEVIEMGESEDVEGLFKFVNDNPHLNLVPISYLVNIVLNGNRKADALLVLHNLIDHENSEVSKSALKACSIILEKKDEL
jgi:hypothetical protein